MINIPSNQTKFLKASAGAGKTREITKRYLFLLFALLELENPQENNTSLENLLQKILAITFSNNATQEMKNRIFQWLKGLYFKNEEMVKEIFKYFKDFSVSFSKLEEFSDYLSKRAEQLIDGILNNYSYFNVKTIDSFMSSLFKACAYEIGYSSDFEIIINNESHIRHTFDSYLRDVKEGSKKAERLINLIEEIERIKTGDSFLWTPDKEIFKQWTNIYNKISLFASDLRLNRYLKDEFEKIKSELEEHIDLLTKFLEKNHKYIKNINQNQINEIHELKHCFINNKFDDLLKLIKKLIKKDSKKDTPKHIKEEWEKHRSKLGDLSSQFALYYAKIYYLYYVEEYLEFIELVESKKAKEGILFIEEIKKKLVDRLRELQIPEMYFVLGETIQHYLIDEFQDTSPLQWKILYPLIEEALSKGGTFFLVGDTKQAIYEFRGADYKIMKNLEKNFSEIFPSSRLYLLELDRNYRCSERILEFVEDFFQRKLKSENLKSEEWNIAAGESGLTNYKQYPVVTNKGYVEVKIFKNSDNIENDSEGTESSDGDTEQQIKTYLDNLIKDAVSRGYKYGDIAILTQKNEDVITLSGWLNELGINEILSYSSLDVRKRKVASEIFELLKFLDNPSNNLAFSTFLLSDLFKRYPQNLNLSMSLTDFLFEHNKNNHSQPHKNNHSEPLYLTFKNTLPDLWNNTFGELLDYANQLPLYELLVLIESKFKFFNSFPEEEATFIKIFELARLFENKGDGTIKSFLDYLDSNGEDDDTFSLNLPSRANAIKLMTIHKAKGLEFPITILYLRPSKNWKTPKLDNPQIIEENEGLTALKLGKDWAELNSDLKKIYNSLILKKKTALLNTLYVGMTRAMDELYIIIKAPAKNYTNLTQVFEEYENQSFGEKQNREKRREEIEKQNKEKDGEAKEQEICLINHKSPNAYEDIIEHLEWEKDIHIKERFRGELIHKVLSTIEYYSEEIKENLKNTIRDIISQYPFKFTEEDIYNNVMNTLKLLQAYFEKREGREVMNEKEFSDRGGALYRIDRLVKDKDEITIIEYKTGELEEREVEEHKKQLHYYKEIVKGIYPTYQIKGILYYIDKEKLLLV